MRHMADLEQELFGRLVDDPDAPGGLDEAARAAEPGNFLRHIVALGASKLADGLIDPKLVLAWLVGHLGAGAFWGGLLVPVREAGALLPQLFTAGVIGGMPRRKWVWAAGAAGQGGAALAILAVALTLRGPAAGAAMVIALAVLALARSACSVAYKDVLGKTVGQSRRGSATGLAASLASAGVIVFAALLLSGKLGRETLVLGAVALAGLCWLLAGAVFASLHELPQVHGNGPGRGRLVGALRMVGQDRQLQLFIVVRCLLIGTALAPPYLVMLAAPGGGRALGLLLLASAIASLVSSWVWGRLADRSSRRVLMWSGLAGGNALLLAVLLAGPGARLPPVATMVVLFGLMIAYHGVRQGRATYLVDMAPPGRRAVYTAVSNTVVGVVLLLAGAGAAMLVSRGVIWVIWAFAIAAFLGAGVAWKLDEASE